MKDLFWFIIKLLVDKKNEDQILTALATDNNFKFLNKNDTETETTTKKFSKSISSGLWLKEHLPSKIRCHICKGHIPNNAITDDHLVRRREDGVGSLSNGKISHPYCNNIYKR